MSTDFAPEKPRWMDLFLSRLAQTGNVSHSAVFAGSSRTVVYKQRRADPEFAAAWDEALETATDMLEGEARRRAEEGLVRKKFHNGAPVIDPETRTQYVEREYSDTLLIFLLKAHRPEKYRERYDVTSRGAVSLNVSIEDLAEADRKLKEELENGSG